MNTKFFALVVSTLALTHSLNASARDGGSQDYIVGFEAGSEQSCMDYLQALNPELAPVRSASQYFIYNLTELQAAAFAQMRCVKIIEADLPLQPLW